MGTGARQEYAHGHAYGHPQAKLTRLRDGEDGFIIGSYALERVDLGFDVDGDPVHSAIVRHVAPTTVAPPARRITPNAQVANDALLKALERHGKPCAGATRSVSEQAWRQEFYEMQRLDENTSKEELKRQTRARLVRFDRARDLLREVEAIDGADGRVWLTIDAR